MNGIFIIIKKVELKIYSDVKNSGIMMIFMIIVITYYY